jgi:hypothetical protein
MMVQTAQPPQLFGWDSQLDILGSAIRLHHSPASGSGRGPSNVSSQ